MSILKSFGARMVTLAIVFGVGITVALFLISGSEYYVPGFEPKTEYTLSVTVPDVDNLVPASEVRVAGVQVGEVTAIESTPEGAVVTLGIVAQGVYPLHEGLNIRVSEKSLIGEYYLEVTDGAGPEIPAETHLPPESVELGVQLYDVYRSLDEDTRAAAGSLVRGLDQSTVGTREGVSATLAGLGSLGREGHTALDAVAAQGEDLKALAQDTTTLLRALDTGQGRIATLVTEANRLTAATAGQRPALEDTMRTLPGVLDSADAASGALTDLSGALNPVVSDLDEAAPMLTAALNELPATTTDLRGLLPSLDGTLGSAPDTLERVPTLRDDVGGIVPAARDMVAELNPVLAYARPYGPELAGFFANFNAVVGNRDSVGVHYARIGAFLNEETLQSPVDLDAKVYENPYPAPGLGADPGPFTGVYPRIGPGPR
ncbi:MlaD family protein [Pseudonocardia pini]|uniref:MlaD family protein n=1 Tax=Pseudonocardia pini TaxID=2758030 RepID=UPI0015F0A75C|nr:MlaD family protein [Pseudonocardia pini]